MRPFTIAIIALTVSACSKGPSEDAPAEPSAGQPSSAPTPRATPNAPTPRTTPSAPAPLGASTPNPFVEGKDYLVLERRMFLDSDGFNRPVEAFSMLFPRGWKTEGGVRWKGVETCRGEMVQVWVRGVSPDGAISFELYPPRAFASAEDPTMLQLIQTGAQHGGCAVNQPFDAGEYIQGAARLELGATASDIRPDASMGERIRAQDAQANAIARQYGNDMTQSTSVAYGTLSWPDGSEGIAHAGVSNTVTRKPDYMNGGVTSFSNTQVFYSVVMRYPAARRDEAKKLFGMVISSQRMNPVWQQAKDQFMTQLGNLEHAAAMDRIRLVGEQSAAYAKARSDDMDRQMRSWERQQDLQDASVKRFVQTIREVETWRDASGGVELSAGYDQAWSRGDGRYILSNSPSFDPSSVFQDQAWQPMQRAR